MAVENILQIISSGRHDGSLTSAVSTELVELLSSQGANISKRDLAKGLPFIDDEWIAANFTDPSDRTEAQKATLALSDTLIAEIKQADTLVIGLPIYNFGVPASVKAWIDLIARARETFRYTETGSVGLLENKKVYLVMASGGVPFGSEVDFASTYITFFLSFIGITDVTLLNAAEYYQQPEAQQKLQALVAA